MLADNARIDLSDDDGPTPSTDTSDTTSGSTSDNHSPARPALGQRHARITDTSTAPIIVGRLNPAHFEDTGARNMLQQWANNGVQPSFSSLNNLPRPQPNDTSVRTHSKYVRAHLGHMVNSSVVSPSVTRPTFVLPLKIVPKSNGKPRMVYNARRINMRTRAPTFRMPTPIRILKHIPRNSYMTRLDISNAYWSIPLHPDFRQHFGFAFERQYYVWNVLPFGWNVSAWALHTVLDFVRKHLKRTYGISMFIYSDDFLVIAPNAHLSRLHTDIVLRELKLFGFAVQSTKCQLAPVQKCEFLGMLIDSRSCMVTMTARRRRSYLRILKWLSTCSTVPLRIMQQVVGYLNFVCPLWPGSRILFTRWIRVLANAKLHTMHVHVDHTDTRELMRVIRLNAPFQFINAEHIVYSDATPWQGGVCWDTDDPLAPVGGLRFHWRYDAIFLQETRAAAIAIDLTAQMFPGTRIVAYIDNQAALGALRKGTTYKQEAWPYLRRVHRTLQRHRCSLSLRYIPSKQNPADFFTRT